MTMRRLELDFLRSGRRPGWVAWTLLAVSLAFALDLGRSWYMLREDIARKESRLASSSPPRQGELIRVSNPKNAQRPLREGEMAAARDTVQRLSIPWDTLFGALEAAKYERATLISIEPDAAAGTLTVTGEAKDYLAALSYVANLEQQKALSRVHLAKHETRINDPQRPVVFTISASWKERR